LSLTDGICKEVTGHYLFIGKNGKPETAIYVERISSDKSAAIFLQPLSQSIPINKSKKERDKIQGFNELNRHMVLHGDTSDYGTKVNSLKVISLINYVTQFVTKNRSDDVTLLYQQGQ
jgi:hypothetical protein